MNFTTTTSRVAGLVLLTSALSAHQTDFESNALATLSLNDGEVSDVSFDGTPGSSTVVSFEYEGTQLNLDLKPHSPMAPDARILEDRGDGELVEVELELMRTLRGSARELPGSLVSGAWMEDGFYGRIRQADGSDLWIQPLIGHVEGATASQHVVYSNADIQEQPYGCGGALLPGASQGFGSAGVPFGSKNDQGAGALAGGATYTCELGVDADFEYYQDYGSNTTTTTNRINLVIDTMNLQYESEVDITHLITTIIVRTTSNDPYSSTDSSTLLDQFMDEWNNNQGGVQRDIAQLFTGKNINGGVIGIAYLGVICNSTFGYGLVESDFNGNFGCATDLSAHELGHNWNAGHCTCASNTMNPFITCANTFSASLTRPSIEAHRDSRTCLDVGPTAPTAEFSGTPLTGIAPLIVTFSDESFGGPTSWSWNFGDGNTSTSQNSANVYATAGTYTVSLTVSNANGSDTETKSAYIVVDGPVDGSCTTRNGTGANPDIYDCSNDPAIGTTWTTTVDAGSVGVSGLSFVFGFAGTLPPLPTAFGEVLVDPTSSQLLLNTSFVIGGTATHNESIPGDSSLIGLNVSTQCFLNQGVLTNAVDIVIGS